MSTDWPFDPETGELMEAAPSNVTEISVSELSFALKRTLEEGFSHVRVRGELSRVSRPASGHCYFDLKDDKSVISAVVWKGNLSRLRVAPEQGLEVIVTGKVTTFPGQSKYQIVVESMEPAGAGALMALLDARKKKLAAEGLFDEDRKQAIPYLPHVIGVVTSPTGAVIRDILHRLSDRFPRHVIVWPVRVQGEQSAAEVARAIRGFNAMEPGGPIPRPDVIIVARGGGSIEDLWSFNEEIVVRAAAESTIPLISAVGHETDTTLIDYASDKRCPTPTAAAELAVPVRDDLISQVADLTARLSRAKRRGLEERAQRLRAAARGLPRPDDILALARQRHDAAASRLAQALRANTRHHAADLMQFTARLSLRPVRQRIGLEAERLTRAQTRMERGLAQILERRHDRLAQAGKFLISLSYQSVLQRGFALVRGDAGLIGSAAAATSGPVTLEFHDGKRAALITDGTPRPKPAKPPGGTSGQGSLL